MTAGLSSARTPTKRVPQPACPHALPPTHAHACTGDLGGLTFAEHTERADALRGRICAELRKRREEIEPFLDEDFESYLARMAQPHTWGGASRPASEAFCALAASAAGDSVWVRAGSGRCGKQRSKAIRNPSTNPIRLAFRGGKEL